MSATSFGAVSISGRPRPNNERTMRRTQPSALWIRSTLGHLLHCRQHLVLPGALLCAVFAGCYEEREALQADQAQCASCHGVAGQHAAPPAGVWLDGSKTETTARGVGAHQSHLQAAHGLAHPVSCAACHLVPLTVDAVDHMDTALPAEVTFGQQALVDGANATWNAETLSCTNYCHGDTLDGGKHQHPVWNVVDGSQITCDSCHGAPPSKLRSGAAHPAATLAQCADCHGQVVNAEGAIMAAGLHGDGVVQVSMANTSCNRCHGSEDNAAPPLSTAGASDVAVAAVGVHQAHVRKTALHEAYACSVCHIVPATVEATGHIDSPPAEVSLSGIAIKDTIATWSSTTRSCENVYCHNRAGAQSTTWVWNEPVTKPIACNACHGFPPATEVHTNWQDPNTCYKCHDRVVGPAVDGIPTITHPERHANGSLN